jgi:uncharacterized protein (TIGR03437 family)
MKVKFQRTGKTVVLIMIIIGLMSYAALPLLLVNTLKVNANGLSSISEMEGNVYAVTAGGKLISFNAITPSAINRNVTITGLAQGETVVGVDFRPRTGQLFALSSASRLYTINTTTGAVTQVGAAAFTPALSGTAFGFDFNPVPDRIRVVSDAEQNLRLNPDNGAVAGTDTNLAYASGDANAGANPNVIASAYTNNFSGASVTTLFGIDSNLDILVRQGSPGGSPNSPNGGQLSTIGALGVNTTNDAGFDISAPGDVALASLTVLGGTSSSLYSINLNTGAATMVGPIGGGEIVRDIAIVTRVETIFALTASNNLVSFNSGTPDSLISTRTITGLQPGESLLGIDFRPATGQLFAVSNASRVYTINTTTGTATPVGGAALATPLNGTAFGFDFNPQPDRIRVVSDARQNLRLNPNNGTLQIADTMLAFAAGDANANATPNAVGAAYTNNVAGTATTTLYVIDSNLDILVLQGSVGGTPNSPNGGQLTTVGALTINTTDQAGFDIAPQTGAAFASLTAPGALSSQLFTINLTSGAATLIGNIGANDVVRDIAVAVRVETVFAVTAGNALVSFNSLTPGTILSTVPISGLQQGETIVGIDFRPASGQLFALGSTSRLYTINTVNGGASPVSTAVLNPALSGTAFGFDFNPVPDRIRVVSDTDQNLRLNPDNGTVAGTDTTLVYATGDLNASANPNAVGAAYTNNFAGTPSTTLYVIDSNLDIIARQGSPGGAPTSPNLGQLSTIGPLGVNTTNDVGFDISDSSGAAYASLTTAGATQSQFYTVNLLSGAATAVGAIGVNEVIRDVALAANFIPSAQSAGLAVVNAASFIGEVVAPDSIAAMFGNFQTQNGQAAAATSSPLPATLGGVSVSINGVNSGLFFVSNGQINFIVPGSVADGIATVTVTNANGTTRTGNVNILRASPGIFTANASGQGTAAGLTTFDGQNYLSLLNPDGTERLVDPGTRARPNFLILFGTGLRRTPAGNPGDGNGVAESVTATIQGVPANVTFAGPLPGFEGVEQLNIAIPPELAGQGRVNVRLVVNGQASNVVTFSIGGNQPQANTQPASLGQTIAGTLTADDQVQRATDGRTYFFDAYRFTASANTTVAFDLRSSLFDATVLLYQRNTDGSLTLIAADDDLGGLGDGDQVNGNALLLTVLPASSDYVVFVTSSAEAPDATGGYLLRLIGNAVQPISFGANLTAAISGSDLSTSAGDYLDAYWFTGAKDDNVQIRMSSASFDSFLLLNQNNGQIVTFDDNSGGGTAGQDSLITTTLPATGIYVIVATPFAPLRFGGYTLSLTRGAAAAANEVELTREPLPGRDWAPRTSAEREAQFENFATRRIVEK